MEKENNQKYIQNEEFKKLAELINKNDFGTLDSIIKVTCMDINTTTDKEGNTLLMYAVEAGNVKAIEYLVEKGADINAKNEYGETALMKAVKKCNLNIIKKLISLGADVEATDNFGNTALMHATITCNVDVCKLLLEETDASIYTLNHDGLTPYSVAWDYFKKGKNIAIYELFRKHAEKQKKLVEGKNNKEGKNSSPEKNNGFQIRKG